MFDNDPSESNVEKSVDASVQGIGIFEIIFVTLMFFSVIGVAITDFSPRFSTYYWFAMLPIFAIGCLIIEWGHSRKTGMSGFSILRSQFLIWSGALLSIGIVYVLLSNGRLDYENTGLIILLLLAFATYSAGIIVDYRLCLLGIAMGLALLVMSYLEEYIWVVLIPASIGIALFLYYHRRKRKKTAGSP